MVIIKNKVKILGVLLLMATSKVYSYDVFHPIKSTKNAVMMGGATYLATKVYTSTTNRKREGIEYKDVSEMSDGNMENNDDWLKIKSEIESNMITVNSILEDQGKIKNCSVEDLEKLILPNSVYENEINSLLPKIQNQPTKKYNVNSYGQLKVNYNRKSGEYLEQDHVPSYAATEMFLEKKGIKEGKMRVGSNLNKNATAIAMPEIIHRAGRTYAGKNSKEKIMLDSEDLLAATVKDITTSAYLVFKSSRNNNEKNDYIQNAMMVYARNKMQCIYDAR